MSSINRLQKISALSTSDLIPLFSNALGDDAAASMSTLLTFLQSQLTVAGAFMTQYFAPNANGWNVTIAPAQNGESVYLLVTPTGGFAAATINMPPQASCVDGQQVLVSCTQTVAALVVGGNGATAVNGAPTAFTANAFFRLRYDGPSKSWYRVG